MPFAQLCQVLLQSTPAHCKTGRTYLEGLASMIAEGADALRVQVLCNLIGLGLEGAVHND